jgi:dihydrolipoamide dehydrogenase
MLLVAVGRMPYLEGLGIEGTKIKVERGLVQVDEFLRTGEPNVYAIGDVIPTPWLAHLASKEGIVAVEQIAGEKNVRPINLRLVPSCTYCDPEIGSVGLTEAKAREAGYDQGRQVSFFGFRQGAHHRRRGRLCEDRQRIKV